ncbi:helix-turn-helix domain-containing protein [Nocardia farcinica]|nr:helix-turn-helix domain-containing protein [Nocardia farcinica]MBF6291842.1 helix-turn-helix domain-containing protein [Nocardia farcinica]MBF6573775.1 helix-turn-helix domain-containing protein [Nocardia farcinica]
MPNSEHPLSAAEVAERLNLSRRAVVDLIRRGELAAQKLPGRTGAYVISPKAVQDYIATRTEAASA